MVNTATSQSLDRLMSTVAIIGLSLAFLLRLLSASSAAPSDHEDDVDADDNLQKEHDCSIRHTSTTTIATTPRSLPAAAVSPSKRKASPNGKKSSAAASFWFWRWPMMKRRKKKRRKRNSSNTSRRNSNNNNDDDSIELNLDESYETTNDDTSSCDGGGYDWDHLGSCKCGSIEFILHGPKHLQLIQSPDSKIQYPHIRTTADRFHLLRGETDMRFQYVQHEAVHDVDKKNNNAIVNHDNDDSSTIATEQHCNEEQRLSSSSTIGAHVFCRNCGVHVMHADRSSEQLEVNANCLSLEEKSNSSPSPMKVQKQQQIQLLAASMSSLSTNDGEAANDLDATSTRTQQQLNSVSEHELFLGSAKFWGSLSTSSNNGKPHESLQNDNTRHHQRMESLSSLTGAQTHIESNTNMLDTPTDVGDDYSMDGSSSFAIPGRGRGATSLSITTMGMLPPLPPPSSRLPPLSSSSSLSESRSVRTLPPWFGERPRHTSHQPSRSVGGGWSIASMETNDLDSVGGDDSMRQWTVSPSVRDQMKFYLDRHQNKESEKMG